MLYVLALPQFGGDDLAQIEKFRVEFEPQRAAMVPPHLTLVFGTRAVPDHELVRIAQQVSGATGRFRIVLSRLESIHDPLDGAWKLFLLPTIGAQSIAAMHDALYAELPASELNTDISYTPHMTIATSGDRDTAQAALSAAARLPLPIGGFVDRLTIVEAKDWRLRTVAQVPLSE